MALLSASRHVPTLMDELLEEIFIRLPIIDDPAIMFRAAFICKSWCCILSGFSLRHRLLEFHSSPPLRGFFCRVGGEPACRFVPTSSSSSSLRRLSTGDTIPKWRPIGSLHGRVLIHNEDTAGLLHGCINLAMWNPIGGEIQRLPRVPLHTFRWNAALLCAGPGCDHLDYGYGSEHFQVVFAGTSPSDGITSVYVYSSEHHAWTKPVSARFHGFQVKVGSSAIAIVGNTLYFLCDMMSRIMEYDLGKQELSLIGLPMPPDYVEWEWSVALMRAEGGGLGFAMTQKSKVSMWLREAASPDNGYARWVQRQVIDLDRILPAARNYRAPFSTPSVSVVAEHVGVIFIGTCDGLFSIDLKSGLVTKLILVTNYIIRDVVPYVSFCTPAFGSRTAFAGDQEPSQ